MVRKQLQIRQIWKCHAMQWYLVTYTVGKFLVEIDLLPVYVPGARKENDENKQVV